MSRKKRSPANLKISTRIIISCICVILIPIIVITLFSTLFLNSLSNYFNLDSVTTNYYSTVNQIQWSMTLSKITEQLQSSTDSGKKLAGFQSYVEPAEAKNALVYIERNGERFYSTDGSVNILEKAREIVSFESGEDVYYYGENGFVVALHTAAQTDEYLVVIVNEKYNISNAADTLSGKDLAKTLLDSTGIILVCVTGVFIIAIIILSFFTAGTIVKPIQKIAKGADEIAKGNLDYEIQYKSTNELGQTVESFNAMRLRLKESIESRRKSDQDRKEMIAGLAHDLRTPLTSIKGYVEGLMDGIADTPEKQERYLKTIYDSTCTTEKLLDELLTVSKLELGAIQLNPQKIRINDFIADGAEEIKAHLEKNNFDFKIHNSCTDQAVVEIDTDHFIRVINNVINNSIKYKDPDEKGKIQLNLTEYEKNIILELRDNGIGVRKESLPKIFDTLYRDDPSRTQVRDGSGLGLAVCKQVIELHGGSIWARSNMGEGLSIFISLPRKREAQ